MTQNYHSGSVPSRTATSQRTVMGRLLLMTLLLFTFIGGARADEVEIGDGGEANNTYLPGYNYYNYSLTQQIYTADEIGMSGTITSIAFKNTGAEKTRTYNIYMLHTDKETFSSGTDWVAMSDNDLVFAGELTFTVGEWTTIELDTPFEYDGNSNLIVGVSDVSGAYSSSPHMACLVFNAPFSQALRAYRDNGAYDIAAPGVTGSVLNVKNQIILGITPGSGTVCLKPTLSVSNVTDDEATLTVGGGSYTYNVQYKLASAENWTDVASNSTGTSFTLTGLTPLTAYEVRVQSVCDGNATSDWRTVSFTTTAVATEVGSGWSDNFEDGFTWELVNGELTNAWAWGTAASNSGTKGLYISNDNGTTNAYTLESNTMVYATKLLQFADGKYEFSYNWLANGESTWDFLRVALVPATITFTAGTSLPSGFSSSALPSDWIALDGGGKLNMVTEWQYKSVAVNVTAGNYYLVVAWRNDNSQGNQPPAAIDNVSITKIACGYEVTDLAVSDITTTSATLSWSAGDATQWQVAYSTANDFESSTEEIVDAATYNMTGLQPGTHYFAKVRAYCGGEDFGSWSDVLELNTECILLTEYPYTENFDGITVASVFSPTTRTLPVCWNAINTTTSDSYKVYPTIYSYSNYANSTPNCLRLYSYYSTSYDPQPQYVILPAMENLAGKLITLQARGYNTSSTFKIGLMTAPTDISTFTMIAEQKLTTSYEEFEYIIPADATATYVAIMIEAANSERINNGAYIDDITIDEAPTCQKPTDLDYNNLAAHTVELSWTSSADAWQICLNGDEDNLIEVLENPYTLANLTEATTYNLKVRTNCGNDGYSEWSKEVSFTTPIACPAPTGITVNPGNYSAEVNWNGTSDNYIVSYRTAAYAEGIVEHFDAPSVPSGWTRYSGLLDDVLTDATQLTSTTSGWGINNYALGQYNMKVNIYGTGCKYWLVTPEFTVNQDLNFDLALTDYGNSDPIENNTLQADDRFVVLIYADDAWHILREWNNSGSEYVYNTISATGENVTIGLSDYYGQDVKIAFYGESTESGGDNDLHIDNVICGIPYEAGEWQTVTVDEATATITGLTPETDYEVKVQGDCGNEGLSLETAVVSFTTLEGCPVPQNVEVDDITYNSATVNWDGYNDSYIVSYRMPAHADGIIEHFDATNVPSGWTKWSGLLDDVLTDVIQLTSTTGGWYTNSYALGQYNMKVNIYGTGCKYWLVSPEFRPSQALNFDLALTKYNSADPIENNSLQADDRFVVLIYADNAWHILREWNNSGSEYVYNTISTTSTTGENVTIDLSDYYGKKVKIAFYGESTNPADMEDTGGDNDLHIDNIVCGVPVEAGEWETVEATESPVILTGLTPETPYEVKLQGFCDGEPTEESETVTFVTTEVTTITNTCTLAEGWNWVSFNIDITLNDLKTALVAALGTGTSGLSIHSQTQNTTYNGSRWRGSLNSLDVAQMYMINVPADCEMVLEGMPIDPAEHPVTISWGDNWIGCPLNESLTVNDAFNGFAAEGDYIMSHTAFAVYKGGQWRGPLTTLEPGRGYIYSSAAEDERPFVFPMSVGGSGQGDGNSYHWSLDNHYHHYQYMQPLVATIQIDGNEVSDENLEIGVFNQNDINVGVARLVTYDGLYVAEIPVYCEEGDMFTFKLYDHSQEIECDYECTPSIEISAGGRYVDYDAPVILSFTSLTTPQQVILTAGENWVSFNIDITLDDLKDALVDALPGADGTVINSQSGGWAVLNNGQWRGSLNSVDVTEMYMINVPDACEITLEGRPLDPSEHPVTICPDYNWIGYPFNENMTLNDAFAGFAVNGDEIMSQTGNAKYNRNRWQGGSLTTLEPGKGYIYHSAASENRVLVFPSSYKAVSGSRSNPNGHDSHWSDFNFHQYQFNQPLVATIKIDNEFLGSDDYWSHLEVAAYVEDVCRGTAFLENRYMETDGDPYPVIEMPVYYNDVNEQVTFKLFDHYCGLEYELSAASSSVVTGESYLVYFDEESKPGLSLNFNINTFDITLDNDATNNSATIAAYNGKLANVTLTGRTLYKDGMWNTICLPFNVDLTADGCPLAGATAKTISNDKTGSFISNNTHVTLTFGEEVETLVAGTPYIIKWEKDEDHPVISEPVFTGVTIDATDRRIEMQDADDTPIVNFIGNYNAKSLDPVADRYIYYMAAGNALMYTGVTRTLGACRAYFDFSPIKTFIDGVDAAREIILDFGDGDGATTAIKDGIVANENETGWYTVDGKKLDKQPARKGVYIHNGSKVVIK